MIHQNWMLLPLLTLFFHYVTTFRILFCKHDIWSISIIEFSRLVKGNRHAFYGNRVAEDGTNSLLLRKVY